MSTVRRWSIARALSVAVEAYVLYYIFHYGMRIALVQWDDCAYILRGLQNLQRLAQGTSLLGLARAGLHLDIHGPLSDLQSMVGLLLFNGQVWGPFVLSGVWLVLLIEALLAPAGSDRPRRGLTALLILFVLVQDLTINTLSNLKSDWAGGLLLAGALVLLVRGAQSGDEHLKRRGAVLLGLAILSKLTAFYLPVVAIITLALFEVYAALLEGGNLLTALRKINRRALLSRIAIAVGPFVFFFVYKIKGTLAYIRQALGSTWSDGLTPLGRAWYYGPYGPEDRLEWGNLHLSFLVFAAAALILAWRRRERAYPLALLVHVAVAAMLFLPLIMAPTDPSFASTLLGVIIAATLLSMAYLVSSLPSWGAVAVGIVALLTVLPAPLPFRNTSYNSLFPESNLELRRLGEDYSRIVDTLVTHARRENPHVMVFYDHIYAPHPNLAIQYFQKTGQLMSVDRVDDLSDPAQIQALPDADFALTVVPATGASARQVFGLYPAYPISKDPGRAEETVRAADRFDLIGVYAIHGGEIHLYGNRRL